MTTYSLRLPDLEHIGEGKWYILMISYVLIKIMFTEKHMIGRIMDNVVTRITIQLECPAYFNG